jgi:hypothetical protein
MRLRQFVRLAVSVCGAALVLIVGVSFPRVSAQSEEGKKLEGSWTITIENTPFRILRTITPGGVIDAYAFPPITPTSGPLITSSGHGDWKKIGPRTYAVTVIYFQLNPPLNATFQILDTVGKLNETIELSADGQTYTSVFETEISLPNGTPIIHNAGTTAAQRIVVEPRQ